ncbi:MAG: glycosyltransferase [Bacteroidetes bacterium]|nr:glycosyltransferase [Bacteroidota bacterium]
MKILVLGSRIPWPLRDGGAIATYGMLKALSAKAEVTFFSYNTRKHFCDEETIQRHFTFCKVLTHYLDANTKPLPAVRSLIAGTSYNIARFDNPSARKKLESLLRTETFDIVHFEGLYTAPFFPVVKAFHNGGTILRQHNKEAEIWKRLAANTPAGAKKWYLNQLAARLEEYENRTLPQFDAIVAITRADSAHFRKLAPASSHFVYPAGVEVSDLEGAGVSEPIPNTVFHLGSMEWMPNRDGLKWFITDVWPTVYAATGATLHIAGKSLNKADREFVGTGVVNHGEVADANRFIQPFSIMIVPLHSGSGIRIKTLESMLQGKAIVTTTVGIQGIDAENGREVVIADSASDFARAVIALLQNPEHANRLGEAARKLVTEHFSVAGNTERLLEFYREILRK